MKVQKNFKIFLKASGKIVSEIVSENQRKLFGTSG